MPNAINGLRTKATVIRDSDASVVVSRAVAAARAYDATAAVTGVTPGDRRGGEPPLWKFLNAGCAKS